MNEQQQKNWYAGRVPFSGRLSDYALTIGQNNRVLQAKTNAFTGSATNNIPPNPNRVAIVATLANDTAVVAGVMSFSLLNPNGTVVFTHQLYTKLIDVAGTSVVSSQYVPLVLTTLDIGPLVQMQIRTNSNMANNIIFITELLMNPKCCDYLDQAKG